MQTCSDSEMINKDRAEMRVFFVCMICLLAELKNKMKGKKNKDTNRSLLFYS